MNFILMICGPLCSGKTTISDLLLKKEKRLYRPSFDKLKSQLSDYNAETDRGVISSLLFALSNAAVEKNLSIIVEGSANILDEMRDFYKNLANNKKYKYIEVNIEADLSILLARLKVRVAEGKSQTVQTEEQFMQRYNKYFLKKDIASRIYFSDRNTPEEITSLVHEQIHNE